jgi:predicted nucleotide-binding protein
MLSIQWGNFMTERPSVFVGSSSEHLALAKALERHLHPHADVYVWNQTFELGRGTLESLERKLALMDFAVLILAPEDITISR